MNHISTYSVRAKEKGERKKKRKKIRMMACTLVNCHLMKNFVCIFPFFPVI